MIDVSIDSEQLSLLNGDADYRAFNAAAAARATQAAAGLVASGRGFGDRKAYISDVAAQLGVPMGTFASMLAHWAAAGLIDICRADLVMEMDYSKVSASEIQKGEHGARYHFIVIN